MCHATRHQRPWKLPTTGERVFSSGLVVESPSAGLSEGGRQRWGTRSPVLFIGRLWNTFREGLSPSIGFPTWMEPGFIYFEWCFQVSIPPVVVDAQAWRNPCTQRLSARRTCFCSDWLFFTYQRAGQYTPTWCVNWPRCTYRKQSRLWMWIHGRLCFAVLLSQFKMRSAFATQGRGFFSPRANKRRWTSPLRAWSLLLERGVRSASDKQEFSF